MTDETPFPELSNRQQDLLALIVRTYSESAEPVSSRTLVEKYNLDVSTATVRNEMSHLEEMGYLAAPHTSAGRIPTTLGYRYYVRNLMNTSAGELTSSERKQIEQRFNTLPPVLEQWLKQAATILARTANTASLVTPPMSGLNRFKHIELISIQGRLVLMVLVLQAGVVHQRMLHLAESVSQTILGEAADRINGICDNLNANEMRVKSHHLPVLESEVVELAADLMDKNDAHPRVIYRDGLSEIISTFSDGTGAQQAVRLFEERAFMDMLLAEVLQPLEGESNLQVIIAGDGRWEDLNRLSMVLTRYGVEGQVSGAMGVLGPTNLNYGRAIHAVRHISNLMTNRLITLYSDEPPKLDDPNS